LPNHDSIEELVCQFNQFFKDKISNIRAGLDAAQPSTPVRDSARQVPPFFSFSPFSDRDVADLIRSRPSKSCPLDPVPTYLLKSYADTLAPVIAKIVNMSLSQGVLPSEMKLALVIPLLNKQDLPMDDFSSSFVSKIIEQIVVK